MNSKKTSKSFIRIFGNSNHKKELLGLMRYRFNHYEELFSYIEKKANKLKNPITYKDLLEYLDLSGTFDEQFFIKPEKRTDLINKSLQRALKAVKLSKKLPKAFTYLDIGAGDASKTDSIRKMLDLSPKQSYCLDLNETPFDTSIESSICNYVLYDGGSDIPFPNNKFNLVTIFFTLHHIVPIEVYIEELFRIIKHGGSIIVREHDVKNQEQDDFVRVIHLLFNVVNNRKGGDMVGYKERYFNKKELRDLFIQNGFKVKKNYNRNSFLYSYYDCFTK